MTGCEPSVPAAERVLREHECGSVRHHEAKHHEAETPQPRVSLECEGSRDCDGTSPARGEKHTEVQTTTRS